jgi:hypothetical protein
MGYTKSCGFWHIKTRPADGLRCCQNQIRTSSPAHPLNNSSLLQAAWFERKPVFVLYPDGHSEWQPDKIGQSYTFGAGFPGTKHQSFSQFDPSVLRDHLMACGLQPPAKLGGLLLKLHGEPATATSEMVKTAVQSKQAFPYPRFRGQLENREVRLTLYPGGCAYLTGTPSVRRWELCQDKLHLLMADGASSAVLSETEEGLTGILEDQLLTITPDLRKQRYLVCGLQRTCTNLIQHYFENQLGAQRVTQFHGGQGYWKHGWLPTASHLRDIFVMVCVRHPLHWLTACYDYFIREFGKDRSICPHFSNDWTFDQWLGERHYAWPTPVERWNVMNGHWLQRVAELGINAVVIRAEDCQTDCLQRTTFSRLQGQYDPLIPPQIAPRFVANRLTNTNQQSTKAMDPTPYLHRTYLERYSPDTMEKTLEMLDKGLMIRLGYD